MEGQPVRTGIYNTATILNNLVSLHDDMGQYAQAELLDQRSLKIREAKLGPEHPKVAQSLNNVARQQAGLHQPDIAEDEDAQLQTTKK